jgi:uncharacterized protein YndB with AHSA1/START domain
MTTIHLETWVPAPARTVFEALTTRVGLDAWWGTCLTAEPAVGHVIEFDHHLGDPLRMRVKALEPDRRVAWRCVSDFTDPSNPASEWLGTSITFDLRSAADDPAFEWMTPRLGLPPDGSSAVTIVDFRHANWPEGARWYPFCAAGWASALDAMSRSCH